MKSVQMRSFFWSVFFCIRTEYGYLLRKSPYSVRIQENMDQKKLRIWTLFTQCKTYWLIFLIWRYLYYHFKSFFHTWNDTMIKKKEKDNINDTDGNHFTHSSTDTHKVFLIKDCFNFCTDFERSYKTVKTSLRSSWIFLDLVEWPKTFLEPMVF